MKILKVFVLLLFLSFASVAYAGVMSGGVFTGINTANLLTRVLIIDTTANGANIASTLTNFTIPVHINSSSFDDAAQRSYFFSSFNNESGHEGKRVIFRSGSTQLKYEVEYYSDTNEEAIYWVKVPSIAGDGLTTITLSFVSDPGSDQNDDANAWDSYYVAVYHMGNNSWTSGATACRDSKGNNHSSAVSGTTDVAALVGRGRYSDADSITFPISTDFQPGNGDFTVSTYFYPTELDSTHFLWRNYGINTENYINLEGSVSNIFDFYTRDGDGDYNIVTTSSFSINTPYWITGTRGGTTSKIYLNGVEKSSSTNALLGTITTNNVANISGYGNIDETRISKGIARSADWILMEYETTRKKNGNYNGDGCLVWY